MGTLSLSVLTFHALAGYCGTQPSVEFFKFIREILKWYIPKGDPVPGPKEGDPNPQPSLVWQIGTGILGGLAGFALAKVALPENPVYTLGAAYIGGRVMSDVVSSFRYRLKVGK